MLPLAPIFLGVWTRNRWLRDHRNRSSREWEREIKRYISGVRWYPPRKGESAGEYGEERTSQRIQRMIQTNLRFTLTLFFQNYFVFIYFPFFFCFLLVSTGLVRSSCCWFVSSLLLLFPLRVKEFASEDSQILFPAILGSNHAMLRVFVSPVCHWENKHDTFFGFQILYYFCQFF